MCHRDRDPDHPRVCRVVERFLALIGGDSWIVQVVFAFSPRTQTLVTVNMSGARLSAGLSSPHSQPGKQVTPPSVRLSTFLSALRCYLWRPMSNCSSTTLCRKLEHLKITGNGRSAVGTISSVLRGFHYLEGNDAFVHLVQLKSLSYLAFDMRWSVPNLDALRDRLRPSSFHSLQTTSTRLRTCFSCPTSPRLVSSWRSSRFAPRRHCARFYAHSPQSSPHADFLTRSRHRGEQTLQSTCGPAGTRIPTGRI